MSVPSPKALWSYLANNPGRDIHEIAEHFGCDTADAITGVAVAKDQVDRSYRDGKYRHYAANDGPGA